MSIKIRREYSQHLRLFSKTMNNAKRKLVVVGNGMAGARTVEEILRRGGGELFNVTVFGDEPHGNYNRILLSNVLNGSQDARDIFLNAPDWYAENNIALRAGVRVEKIDRAAQRVLADDGSETPYDVLLLATGSRPFVPPMDGLKTASGENKPGVFVFRTLDDCRKISGYATKCRRAVVLGGGLLGLEAARGLINYGCEVHVVHLAPRLMDRQLDATSGAMLRDTFQKMGLHVHLEKSTAAVLGDEMVTGLRFADGSELSCDMIVVACGVRPNVELARDCTLQVERAILVNNQMRSLDDENVFVVGECAQHDGQVYGLVAPLWEQARVLADVVTGAKPGAAYRGSKVSTKLKVMGVELAQMGATEARDGDEVVQWIEPKRGRYKKLIIRDGKLCGAILLGETKTAGRLMQLFERAALLPEAREDLLFETSAPAPAASGTLAAMPDSATVCNCNGVAKSAIRQCVIGGAHDLESVMRQTRAGTGCGSCKVLVRELIDWTRDSAGA